MEAEGTVAEDMVVVVVVAVEETEVCYVQFSERVLGFEFLVFPRL